MLRTYNFICTVVAAMKYCFLLPRVPLTLANSCPDTYFAYNDSCVPCACQNSTEVCEQAAGVCTSGCRAGFHGAGCQHACPAGKFGKNCEETCICPLGCTSCDNVSGSCQCLGDTDISVGDKYQISSLTSWEAVMGLMLGYSCFIVAFNLALYFLWVKEPTEVGPE